MDRRGPSDHHSPDAASASAAPAAGRKGSATDAPLAHWQLAVLAVAGDLAWRAALLLPWVLGLLLGALWWRQAWMWWLLAAVLPLLAWSLWPRAELPGDALPLAQAPGLEAALRQLLPALQAPAIHALRLDDSFNAAAVQTGPGWWPWGQRRTLVLGLPLLAVLTPAQARAVVAHELGHFSRRHGRLGHWLYRSRAAWLALAATPPLDDSPFDRAVHHFARWFGPWFGARALAHARACEFEADAAAAQAADAVQLVSALATLGLAERWLSGWALTGLRQHKLLEAQAPIDWWQRLQTQWLQQAHSPRDLNAVWPAAAGTAPTGPALAEADTHPPLAARAQALGVQRGQLSWAPPAAEHCAGAAWLADWPAALARANAAWRTTHALQWQAEHRWLALCAERVRAHEAATQARLGRMAVPCGVALAMQQLGRQAEAQAWLELLYAQGERSPALLLALSEWALTSEECTPEQAQQALAWLDQAVLAEPALARAARQLALDWARAQRRQPAPCPPRDDVALADGKPVSQPPADSPSAPRPVDGPPSTERLAALLARAQARRQQGSAALEARLLAGDIQAPGLDPAAVATVQQLCAEVAPVQAAWLASAPVRSLDGRPFTGHALVVQVAPAAMAQAGHTEDTLAQPFAWLLSQARPSPGDLVLVRVCFSSERMLPEALSRGPAAAWRRAAAPADQMSSLSSAPNS